MKSLIVLAILSMTCDLIFSQDKVKIYLANDDHTDLIWTATLESYQKAFLETLDYYLNLADETDCLPSDCQSRWNCDGSYWMWVYEKYRTKEQFERLISRIKDGHISVPLNALALCLGSTPTEGILRGMYYSGKIERQFGLRFPLAYQIENQTMAYGLGSLWAGSGAKYSWAGICGCDTRIKNFNTRKNYIYWWLGNDSSKLLMKWYPLLESNQSFGGYAEARRYPRMERFLTDTTFRKQYPYNLFGLFGKGWDDLETMTREFTEIALFENTKEYSYRVSNETDFFQEFEKLYGDILPSQSVGFGNDWELYTAYLQETTSRMLRSIEKLRSAEALASLVSLKDTSFMDKYIPSRDSAWMNIGLFWEHDWGVVYRSAYVEKRIKWQNEITNQVEQYVNRLYIDAKSKLGSLISFKGKNQRFFVFNPLGFQRDDYVDLPYSGDTGIQVIDLSSRMEVPFQIIQSSNERNLRILAQNIPSIGYKVYEIRQGKGIASDSAIKWENGELETPYYKIRFASNGAIISLIEKKRDNKEWVRTINGRNINDLGGSNCIVSVYNTGCISTTIKIDAEQPLKHTTYYTFYKDNPRIDISNEITENFEGNYDWAFGFNLESPQVWHEETGAVIKADLSENGGNYSSQNAKYDWLTLGHFTDISNENVGIAISSPDCNFMQLGNSTIEHLDTKTPQIKILAGADTIAGSCGIPFIRRQGGASHFLQRFSLMPHEKFQKTSVMKFSLEHQNPLISGFVRGGNTFPEDQYSFIKINNPKILLWALKPAEEGVCKEGFVVRLWNLNDKEENFSLSFSNGINEANQLTHIETPIKKLHIQDGILKHKVTGQQLVSLSFKPYYH